MERADFKEITSLYDFLRSMRRRAGADEVNGLGKCRRVNIETVVQINRSYLKGINAISLIDRNYSRLKGHKLGEHLIGLIEYSSIEGSYCLIFDATADQIEGSQSDIMIWRGPSLEETLKSVINDIGGTWHIGM